MKGVGPDARETAKDAARRAGMTLGEWLNTVIASAQDEAASAQPQGYPAGSASGLAPGSPEDRLTSLIASLKPAPPQPAPNPTAHLASLVETAVLDGRRRAEAVEGKTAAAMQALIDWVERTDTTMREEIVGVATAQERASLAVREALALVTAKIDAIQQHSAAGGEELNVVRQSLATLETRLDALDRQAADGPLSPPLAATLADLENRLTALASRIDADQQAHAKSPEKPPEPDRIARIEGRLDEILARLAVDESTAALGSSDETASALDRVRLELAGLTQKLETLGHPAPSPDFAQLRGDLADVVAAVRASSPRDALDSIQANVSAMADSMERLDAQPAIAELRRELSGKIDRLAEARPEPDLESLRSSLGAVVAAVRANAPDAKLDEIRQDLREMRGEIAPLGGLSAQIARLGSLRTPDAEPTGSLDAIQERLGHITSRLDGIGDGERIIDRVTDVLGDRIAALHGLVEAGNGDSLRRADVERLVDSLAARLEESQHSEGEFARRMLESIEEQLVGALRDNAGFAAQPAAPPATPPADGALEQRLSELANRIDEMSAGGPASGDLDDIRARLDSMQLMVGQMLRATPDLSGLEALVRDLGQKIEGAQQAGPPGQSNSGQQSSAPQALTVAEKIAAAAAAAQTARTIAVDTGRRPGTPSTSASSFGTANPLSGDRVFEFGAQRPGTAAAAARTPETPEAPTENSARASFIAAARKASQSASGGQPAASSAPEPEINDDRPRAATPTADPAPRSRRRLLLGVALIVLAIGGAMLAVPLVLAPSTSPAPQASRSVSQADVPPAGQAGRAEQEPDSVGAIGPAERSVPPVDKSPVESLPPIPGLNDVVATLLPNKLLREARAGNPAAEFEVGARLADGKGVPRDPKAAAKLWMRAAMQGLAPAQYRLGAAYEKGLGLTADIVQAKTWYLRAAERGNVRAMHNLGVLLADGAGAAPDYPGAAHWFRKAADFGLRDSQYNLAVLSARGIGIAQSLPEAWVLFSLAAAQGDEDAGRKRDEVASRLDATAIAKARLALAAFRPRPSDTAANDVAAPAGGWDDAAGDKPQGSRS